MKLVLILFILGYVVLTQKDWYFANNPVFLDQQSIGAKILKQGDIKIITFLTPLCRFCPQGKKMIDLFKAQLLKGHRQDVKFYFVNCNAQEKLCQQFSITMVPYIIVFNKHGKVIEELPGQRQPVSITSGKVRNAIHVVDIHEYQLQRALSLRHMRQQHIQGQQKIPQTVKKTTQNELQTDGTSQNKQKEDIKDKIAAEDKVKSEIQADRIQNNIVQQNIVSKVNSQNEQINNSPKQDFKEKTKKQQNNNVILTTKQQPITKIDVDSMLPNETKAKVLEEIMQTRKRRSNLESLKITSNVGSAILIIFVIGLTLYLKNIVANSQIQKNIYKQRSSRSPEQYDNSLPQSKQNNE